MNILCKRYTYKFGFKISKRYMLQLPRASLDPSRREGLLRFVYVLCSPSYSYTQKGIRPFKINCMVSVTTTITSPVGETLWVLHRPCAVQLGWTAWALRSWPSSYSSSFVDWEYKVIVCVSVISRRRRIIARMRSIGF